jgi:hypothetical protein
MKITAAGIIRNKEQPRVGVTSMHNLASWAIDEIETNGIDLTWESFLDDLRERGINEDSEEWQREVDYAEFDSRTILFGDWAKDKSGKYSIDRNGPNGFAAEYSSAWGNVTVEWSRDTKACHHTSPCYVMSDGSGPCGDLDTDGDSVVAYTLPADWFNKD